MFRITLSFTLLLLSPLLRRGTGAEAIAQDTPTDFIRQKLESLAESSGAEETDYSSLIENLDYYKKYPINLNNTTTAELSAQGLLDELQIENLLSHIDKNGKLLSVYELQSIEGFDRQAIEKILPYIKVSDITETPHASLKEILRHGNHEFLLRGQQVVQKQKGFLPLDSAGICNNPNSRYIGSPQKIYARYRFTYGNHLSAGITGEKDPGELFFKNNNKYNYPHYDSLLKGKQKNGFDFYSAHIYLKNIRFIKALAIGDYQIGFGQGLTAWSGLAYGKNQDAVVIKRNATGIRPYTSTDENLFMRGLAFSGGNNTFQVTGFLSRKKTDARVTQVDSLHSEEALAVSSLQETGLHTTPVEIANKGAITQTAFGGNISYRKRKYSFGLTGIHTLFDALLNRTPETYNRFYFNGKQLTNASADYSFLLHNFNFFGETSISSAYKTGREGLAFIHGCLLSLGPTLSLAILHRSLQRNFQSLYANAFAENFSATNEHGVYFGINAKPTNSITINAYYDQFTFPWLKYQVNAPSNGSDFLVQINYTLSKKFDTYLRVKRKDKFLNNNLSSSEAAAGINEIDFITPYQQTDYRWNINYMVSSSVKLGNRIEYIKVTRDKGEGEEKNGYLVYQDATYRKIGSKISFTLRYALFDIGDYESRIYAYENDIPGSYSIPSYFNKGSRVYAMCSYTLSPHIELWLRWSQIYYSNLSILSPGTPNEIQGHSKTEIKMQMRIKI